MTVSNFSLNDITEVYKTLITNAVQKMEDAKDKIGDSSNPNDALDFQKAEKTWELMNTTAFSALSSVADSLKESLRQR